MAKKSKKYKEMQRRLRELEAGAGFAGTADNGNGPGVLAGLSRLLPSNRSDQFLMGLVLGAAATYVLSDDELRGKIMKSGVQLYSSLAGGLAEMKEQLSDIQAEVTAEQHGTL